jgi:hypothetical protein
LDDRDDKFPDAYFKVFVIGKLKPMNLKKFWFFKFKVKRTKSKEKTYQKLHGDYLEAVLANEAEHPNHGQFKPCCWGGALVLHPARLLCVNPLLVPRITDA